MTKTENKMGTQPIPKLLFTMSLPIIISMLVQSLYNVIDSIFVSRINEDALAAVSIAFPFQNLIMAIAIGTGVGINALISRALGAKDYKKANRIAENGFFIAGVYSIVFLIVGLLFSGVYMRSQTKDPVIIQYGIDYLRVVIGFSAGVFFQIIAERVIQSTGKTVYTMATQTLGAVINIVLDPILIFGLFGLPKMGVMGAGVATVIGQIVAAIVNLFLITTRSKEVEVKNFAPDFKLIKNIYSIAIPSIALISINSVTVFFFNKILNGFSKTAIAMFGVYTKLQSFALMPIFGLNNGMVPIIGYNYGARNPHRIKETIKCAMIGATGMLFVSFLIFQIFPDTILSLFKPSEEMLAIGIPALRIISLSFLIAGISIISSAVFQALGNGFLSLVSSVLRQLLVLIPVAFFLSRFEKIDLIWYSYLIAEIVAVIFSLAMQKYFVREKLRGI